MKILIFIVILICYTNYLSAQSEGKLPAKHQLFASSLFDYYPARGYSYTVFKPGFFPVEIHDQAGYRLGLSYNLRLGKKNARNYFTTDIYYARHPLSLEYKIDARAFLHIPDWPYDENEAIRFRWVKNKIQVHVGYEHRFPLRGSHLQLLASARTGLIFALSDESRILYTFLGPFNTVPGAPWGSYSAFGFSYSIFPGPIPTDIAMGLYLPIKNWMNCKFTLNYNFTLGANMALMDFSFYDRYGEIIGAGGYFGPHHHFSMGFSFGFW